MTNFVLRSRISLRVSRVHHIPQNLTTKSLETRSITEPAGALALAGLKRYILSNNLVGAEKKFVVVVSGANMNFDRLRFVAERAELGEGREALLSVDIPERPGRYVISQPCRNRTYSRYPASSPYTLSFTHVPSQNLSIGTTSLEIERTFYCHSS